MISKRRKLALLGAAGGIVSLGGVVLAGGAFAQTPGATPSATPRAGQQQRQAQEDQFLNDLAKNLGVDRTKLDTALKTTDNQEIDAALASGKLTQAEATKLKQAVADGKLTLGVGPMLGDHGAQIPANVRQAIQDAVSKALGGETLDQIRADLQAGKTPDQIAQAHGTTVAAVDAAVVSAVQPLLNQAVTAGTITATQEQEILDHLKNAKGLGDIGFHGGPREGGPRAGASATPSATQ